MMFGREARLPVDPLVGGGELHVPSQPQQSTSEFVRFQAAHELARERMEVATRRYKDYYDTTAAGAPYKTGDRVWRMVHYRKKGRSKKLSALWEGPYMVIKKITDVVYRLKKEGGRKRVVVHFNNLKKCHGSKNKKATPGAKDVEETSTMPTHPASVRPRRPEKRHNSHDEDANDDDDWITEPCPQQAEVPTDPNNGTNPTNVTIGTEPTSSTVGTEPTSSTAEAGQELTNGQAHQTVDRPSRSRKRPT